MCVWPCLDYLSCAAQFREWDTNGDGLIQRDEFHDAVRLLGFDAADVPNEAIDALFDELDADGSGECEYHELKQAIEGRPPSEVKVEVSVTI